MADDKNWWKRKGDLMFRSEADRLAYDSIPDFTPKEEMQLGLTMLIHQKVIEDAYNPDDYSDSGGEFHNDSTANPHSIDFQPHAEDLDLNAYLDDYLGQIVLSAEEGNKYALLNEYLYVLFPIESDHINTMTLVIFAKLMDIDFSDVMDLVAMHPSKPSTTGLSKLRKELQGVNKKILTDVIMDYIQMMKDAGMPSINEDHIIAMKDKGLTTLAEFWHIYGAMAKLVDEDTNYDANESALKRFREKISDDKNVLYPLLAYLYSQWANDKDFMESFKLSLRQTDGFNGLEAEYFDNVGYSGLMYAKKVLENPRWAEHGFNLYKNRKEDWNEFMDSNFDSLDDFIKNKYFT
jgi:hypothetical protein